MNSFLENCQNPAAARIISVTKATTPILHEMAPQFIKLLWENMYLKCIPLLLFISYKKIEQKKGGEGGIHSFLNC